MHPTTPPNADSALRADWVAVLSGNLRSLFRNRIDVLVAANLPWLPVQGQPQVRQSPSVFVAFGRPPGERDAYLQWQEAGAPPKVVFEVLGASHDAIELADKLAFYDEHGVEEYYLIDPRTGRLAAYHRAGEALRRAAAPAPLVSPRLQISFDHRGGELVVRHPGGKPFLPADALLAEERAAEAKERADRAEMAAAEALMRAEVWERRADRLAELSRKLLARQQLTEQERTELEELARSEEDGHAHDDQAPRTDRLP